MSRVEIAAAPVAAVVAALPAVVARLRRTARPSPGRATGFLLWLAIASPLLFLLTYEGDRPRLYVAGAGGRFEALRLLSFAVAAAGDRMQRPLQLARHQNAGIP